MVFIACEHKRGLEEDKTLFFVHKPGCVVLVIFKTQAYKMRCFKKCSCVPPLHVMPWQYMRNVLKVARTRIVPRLVRLCVTVYAAMLLCNVAPGSFKQMYEQLYDWGDAHFLTLDHPSFASVFAPDPSSHMCLHSIVELFLKEDAEKIYIYAKIILTRLQFCSDFLRFPFTIL